MKYIRVSFGIILFPATMRHDEMASYFGGRDNFISAGVVCYDHDKQINICSGYSTTLRISSREEDTEILNNQGII